MNPDDALSRVRPGQGLQRERLQQLKDYQLGQNKGDQTWDQTMKEDFAFLLGFCSDAIKQKVRDHDISQVGFDHLVGWIFERLREDSPLAGSDRVIDMVKGDDGKHVADFSQTEFKRVLYEKFYEFRTIYRFDH